MKSGTNIVIVTLWIGNVGMHDPKNKGLALCSVKVICVPQYARARGGSASLIRQMVLDPSPGRWCVNVYDGSDWSRPRTQKVHLGSRRVSTVLQLLTLPEHYVQEHKESPGNLGGLALKVWSRAGFLKLDPCDLGFFWSSSLLKGRNLGGDQGC